MGKANLSIIIISYNTKKVTEDCLNSIHSSLKNSQLKIEVIVIDNGSTDGSVEMLKNYQNIPVKTLFNEENAGFGKANNQGVKAATSDYILFLNSDILVLDDAIEKLFKFYQQNEKSINFLGGKLLNKDMSEQPSCGPFYVLSVVFAALFLRGDYWGLTRSSPNTAKKVDWISGACILTKKEHLKVISGFDEHIFMYMDEIDLLYRAKKEGSTTFFYPGARFIHLGSASSGNRTYPIQQVYRGFIYFYKKHRSPTSLFLLRIMLQLKAVIGLAVGYLLQNEYLKETYEKALKIAQMD